MKGAAAAAEKQHKVGDGGKSFTPTTKAVALNKTCCKEEEEKDCTK